MSSEYQSIPHGTLLKKCILLFAYSRSKINTEIKLFLVKHSLEIIDKRECGNGNHVPLVEKSEETLRHLSPGFAENGGRRKWKERRIECIKIINYKIHEKGEMKTERSRSLQKYEGKSNEVPVYVYSLSSVYSADRRRTSELKCRFSKIFSRLSNRWSMFLTNYHRFFYIK